MQNRIRQLMESQHMNQQNFSQQTGIKAATLSGIFTGRTNPTVSIISAIRNTFPNVSTEWLMWGTGEMFLSDSGTRSSSDPAHNTSSNMGGNVSSQNAESVTSSNEQQAGMADPNEGFHQAGMTQIPPESNQRMSANMAHQQNLAPDLFTNIPASQPQVRQSAPSTPSRGQQRSQQVSGVKITTQPQSMAPQDYVVPQSAPVRKITEIRVFYDDQTWESFVPKK